MVTPTGVPCDSSAEVALLVKDYTGAAESIVKLSTKVDAIGDRLFVGWPGPAERMTARELRAVGRFCKRLGRALGDAAEALETYRVALVAFEAVKPAATTATTTPTAAGDVTALNKKAATAAEAIVKASRLIGKGDKKHIDAAIASRLPFQRDNPLVPGSGGRSPHFGGTIGPKSSAADVRAAQEVFRARGWRVPVNGKWDAQTASVVHQFQVNKGLPRTGRIDSTTWHAMWTKKIIW